MKLRLYAIAALFLSGILPNAGAQPDPASFGGSRSLAETPAAARRITARFDFEPIPGDTATLPPNWVRAQHDPPLRVRPGFPIWNRGEYDREVVFQGSGSVRLDLEGGSSSMLLNPGVIQVFPDADYAVVGRVRTRGVDFARARLVARLLDREGNAIPGGEVSSDRVLAPEWTPISVRINGDFEDAVSLQIELLFEQPTSNPDHPDPSLEIVRQDYQGSAWFDDLVVLQVPRVESWIDAPGNLILSKGRPKVEVFVRDLVSEPLTVRFELHDASGELVAEQERAFTGGRFETSWIPEVDRFGWYRASVRVLRGDVHIGASQTAFVWTATERTERVRARAESPFSISVDGLPNDALGVLAELAHHARTPRVLTDLQGSAASITPERINALSDLAAELGQEGLELGIAVKRLPPSISAIGGPAPVLRAIADETADGAAWLTPILVDLGYRVRWWRMGAFSETLDSLAIGELERATARMRELVPGGILESGWSSFDAIDPAAVRIGVAIAQSVHPSLLPRDVPEALSGVNAVARAEGVPSWNMPVHTAVFEAERDDRAAIDEMLLNAIHAWAAFSENPDGSERERSLRLHNGWRWHGGRRPQLMPNPGAAAWLTLVEMLRDRRAEVLPRVVPGVRGVLLTPLEDADERVEPIAVFWAAPGPDPVESFSLLLSPDRVERVDIFGNRTLLEATVLPNSHVRAHEIEVSTGPVYVRGVDENLLRLLASIRLNPAMVGADTEPRQLGLMMANPWATAIQGEYFILEPGNLSTGTRAQQDRRWDIDPRFGSFSIARDETVTLPTAFDVSPAVETGPAVLMLDLDLQSPTVAEFVRVERVFEVGLESLRMDLVASYEPDPSGEMVVVYAVIENTGTVPQNITLKVDAAGFTPQRSAPTIVPAQSRVVKPFQFADGRSLLAGKRVVAGLTNRETGERLRATVEIDDGR